MATKISSIDEEEFWTKLKVIVREAVAEAMNIDNVKSSMLSSDEVQKIFGISRVTLWRWTNKGKLVAHDGPGRKKIYFTEDIQKLIK